MLIGLAVSDEIIPERGLKLIRGSTQLMRRLLVSDEIIPERGLKRNPKISLIEFGKVSDEIIPERGLKQSFDSEEWDHYDECFRRNNPRKGTETGHKPT